MKKITVNKAEENELNWINAQYNEANFVKSNFDNEFIVIAKMEGDKAGLGRLVKIDEKNIELGGIYVLPNYRGLGVAEHIVRNLCEHPPFKDTIIWCLPFENLLNFYSKFGFKHQKNLTAPKEIIQKLNWCNTNNKYEKKVILLSKTNN